MRRVCLILLLGLVTLSVGRAGVARACGGGLVTVPGGAGADAQRILFSLLADRTEVITEVGVPGTTSDYGVLLPVPAQPTLDARPIAAAELDALDRVTAPRIYLSSHDGGGFSCGCGSAKSGGEPADGGVSASQPVNIGPVTAVVLTGDTGDAVNAWLVGNGFVIPADQQPLVDAYAGAGRFFIAIRRSDTAATGGPTSVGVHFTLPGPQRTLPLRFARLGAAAKVAFTVFVVTAGAVGPSDPFAALTLQDLDAGTLRGSGYVAAVEKAVADLGGRAFVVDGSVPVAGLSGRIGTEVEALFEGGAQLTRLTTILPAAALTDDVTFDRPIGLPMNFRYVQRPQAPGGAHRTGLSAAAALALTVALRRRRGPTRRPA